MLWNQSSTHTHAFFKSINNSPSTHSLHSFIIFLFFCREHASTRMSYKNIFWVPHEHYFVSKREKVEMKNCNSCWRHSRCCLSMSNDKNEFFLIESFDAFFENFNQIILSNIKFLIGFFGWFKLLEKKLISISFKF